MIKSVPDGYTIHPLRKIAELLILNRKPLSEEVLFAVTSKHVRISISGDSKAVGNYNVVAIQPHNEKVDSYFLYCVLHVFSDRILRASRKRDASLLEELSNLEVPLLSLEAQIEIGQIIKRVLSGPRSVSEIIEMTAGLSRREACVEDSGTDRFLASIREERQIRLMKAKENELRRVFQSRIRTSSVGYEPIHVLLDLLIEFYFYDKASLNVNNVTVMEHVLQDYFAFFDSTVGDMTSGQKLSQKEKKYLDWILSSKAALSSCGLVSEVLSKQAAVWKNYIDKELLTPPSKRDTISVVWGALGSHFDAFNSWMLTEDLRNEGIGYVRKKMIIEPVVKMMKVREEWRNVMKADLPHGWIWVKLDEISEEDIGEKPAQQFYSQFLEFDSARSQHEGEYLLIAEYLGRTSRRRTRVRIVRNAEGPFRRFPIAYVVRGPFVEDGTYHVLRIREGISPEYVSAYINVVNIFGYSGDLSVLLPPREFQDTAEEALSRHFKEYGDSPTCVPIEKSYSEEWENIVIKETFKRLVRLR